MIISDNVMAILLNQCSILQQTWSGHILNGDHKNRPNFGVRKFLSRVHVYAKFHENPKGSGFFFVDLVWNDPCMNIADNEA